MKTQRIVELCKSKNSKSVWYDPIGSHTATHFKEVPNLKSLTIEAISNLELSTSVIDINVDMLRVIGVDDLVEVNETDEVVYAIRKNRPDQGYVPFTTTRKQSDSRFLSIHLLARDNETYELLSVWVGDDESPPFPNETDSSTESIKFWSTHALVWQRQEIVEGSAITACPW